MIPGTPLSRRAGTNNGPKGQKGHTMPKYAVRVREMHEAFYTVEAKNPEDALMNVAKNGVLVDNSGEFIELADPQFWAVTAKDDEPITPITPFAQEAPAFRPGRNARPPLADGRGLR